MIKNITLLSVFVILIGVQGFGQTKGDFLDSLKQNFENFNYSETITMADSILRFSNNPTGSQLIEIYRMKGISEFSLLEDQAAKKSFQSILRIDKNYELDSAKTSPKIITFFDDIKRDFLVNYDKQQKNNYEADSLYSAQIRKRSEENISKLRNAMVRSLVIPGWGHLYLEEKPKGIILTTLSSISLASAIYFFLIQTTKRMIICRATDPQVISEKRDLYYQSNRWKNISILSFSVLWLYSQIDMLFLHEYGDQNTTALNNMPTLQYNSFSWNSIELSIFILTSCLFLITKFPVRI